MIRFACPSCKKPLQVADQQGGAVLACPYCKVQMRAPQAPAATAPRPPAPAPNQAIAARPPVPPAAPPTAPRPTAAPPAAAIRPPQAPPAPMPQAPAGAISPRANPAPAPMPPTISASPPAPPVPDISGPAWKVTMHKVGRGSAAAGKWLATEVAQTSKATLAQTVRIVSFGSNSWRARSLRGREKKAEFALGERLMQAGSGQPQLRQQIAALDETIQTATAAKQPTKQLKAQRQQLIYQLAAAALTQPALPAGAEVEVKQVQEVRAALKKQDAQVQTARAALKPPNRATALRVGVGYACFGVAVVLAAGSLNPFSGSNTNPVPDNPEPAVVKLDTSVKFVPEDAAFYASFMRNREQVEIVQKTNFWKRLSGNQEVLGAWQMFANNPRGPLMGYMGFRADPENRELVDLIDDMWGEEVFVYGGSNTVDTARIVKSGGAGLIEALTNPGAGGANNKQLVSYLKELSNSSEPLRVPDIVIGFRLSKPEVGTAGVKRIESLLKKNLGSDSTIVQNLSWKTVAGNNFLVLTLEGKSVQWELTPVNVAQGELDGLMKKLSQAKLTVSLGVRDKYLLLGIGESTAHIEKLGQGKSLAERPEMKPLAAQGDKRFVRVGYESETFRHETSIFSPTKKDLADTAKRIKEELIPMIPGVDEDKKKRIGKHVDEFFKESAATTSNAGALVSFTFLTDRGWESYDYDWTENQVADGSKPLTMLDHIGGDPLIAAVSRQRYQPQSYQRFVKWLKVLYGYGEEQLLQMLPEDQKQLYAMVFAQVKPYLERMDKATSGKLLPSLQDGQTGWVIDAKTRSKRSFPGVPMADNPLPLPELAILLGVSDADQLRQAGSEYLAIVNGLIAIYQERMGNPQPPSNTIPPPESAKIEGGQLYYYPIPAGLDLDDSYLPCAGLSSQILTLGFSRGHAERLLATKTPNAGLLRSDRPLASGFWFNWASIVDSVGPWVEHGIKRPGGFPPPPQEVSRRLASAREVMEFLKVFRNYSCVTYFEDAAGAKAEVSHSEFVFQDLAAQ